MTVSTLIEMLQQNQRKYGDTDIVFMVNGSVHYADSIVGFDKEYNETIIEINEYN